MALAHSRGLLDYEERVCAYWPEFAQQGKEKVTVRQLLSHQAGLFALDAPVDRSVAADLDRLAVILAQQKPAWEPGTRQAYHAQTLGYYESELLRRVDPRHRSLGQFFHDEIASPLALGFYIRLPEEIPNTRLATIEKANSLLMMFNVPLPLMLAFMNRRSPTRRAVFENPGPWLLLIASVSMLVILKTHREMGSVPRARSRVRTAFWRPAATNSGCVWKRCKP
jgi:CubicO group peptidase (beta-lactamase class C family)